MKTFLVYIFFLVLCIHLSLCMFNPNDQRNANNKPNLKDPNAYLDSIRQEYAKYRQEYNNDGLYYNSLKKRQDEVIGKKSMYPSEALQREYEANKIKMDNLKINMERTYRIMEALDNKLNEGNSQLPKVFVAGGRGRPSSSKRNYNQRRNPNARQRYQQQEDEYDPYQQQQQRGGYLQQDDSYQQDYDQQEFDPYQQQQDQYDPYQQQEFGGRRGNRRSRGNGRANPRRNFRGY
eukprot:TRINITY_DN407_c0_g2_i2.p1 TRINITY_DN407_c0_g2~~TRINITY_DN407_c0_g2_i2.p1  ORF type:complete len:241 (+),score=69.63 TRINITY_DN407_c0_g2_i2:24-725(+)